MMRNVSFYNLYCVNGSIINPSNSPNNGPGVCLSMSDICFFLKILIKYHSKECQKNHWIYHKNDCRPVQLGVDDIIHLKKRENHSTGNCYEEIENLWKNITKSRVNNTDLLIHSHEAALLLYHAEQIQIQHERLEVEISAVIQSLTQSLRKLNVTLPEKKRVKNKSLSQLKSRENILSLVERCNSSDVQTQLESTKECRKLLSGKKKTKKKLKFFLIFFQDFKNSFPIDFSFFFVRNFIFEV